jgi:hypothetical protein
VRCAPPGATLRTMTTRRQAVLRLITSSNLVGCVTSREAIETLGIDVPDKSLALADTVTHATTRVMNFYIIGVVVVMVAGFLGLHV